MKLYSPMQIAVSAFIGTPAAASFLLGRNLMLAEGKRLLSLGTFVLFAGAYFFVTLLNPVLSRLLDTVIAVGFTIAILFANYILLGGVQEGERPSSRRTWWEVIGISLLFCLLWIALVFFVFN